MSFLIAGIFFLLQTGSTGLDGFIQAAENGRLEELKAHVGLTDISVADSRGRTALLAAAEKRQREAFGVLLSLANADLKDVRAQLAAADPSEFAKLLSAIEQRSRLLNGADRNG